MMQVTELDINEIIPYVNNPRDNSAAIDAVASSIKAFGFNVPLVLDRDKIVVTGHTRLAMGWDVPTMKRIVGHSDVNRDHWTGKSQFNLPTATVYNALKAEAERQRKEKGIHNDAFKREYDDLKREYYSTRAYFNNTHDLMTNVWHFPRTSAEERELTGGHASPKPLALCARAIKSSSREGETVLDLFGGSGSTLIACEQLNRRCFTMELDPRYCDVIIKRWETLTGKKAVKL